MALQKGRSRNRPGRLLRGRTPGADSRHRRNADVETTDLELGSRMALENGRYQPLPGLSTTSSVLPIYYDPARSIVNRPGPAMGYAIPVAGSLRTSFCIPDLMDRPSGAKLALRYFNTNAEAGVTADWTLDVTRVYPGSDLTAIDHAVSVVGAAVPATADTIGEVEFVLPGTVFAQPADAIAIRATLDATTAVGVLNLAQFSLSYSVEV